MVVTNIFGQIGKQIPTRRYFQKTIETNEFNRKDIEKTLVDEEKNIRNKYGRDIYQFKNRTILLGGNKW